jgi:hypothetical protein
MADRLLPRALPYRWLICAPLIALLSLMTASHRPFAPKSSLLGDSLSDMRSGLESEHAAS